MMANKDLKFLKNAIKSDGKRIRVHYSQGTYTTESKIPKGTITIYAKDYGSKLPKSLSPINESDIMTDYFEKDKARITPKNPHYKILKKLLKEGRM